MRTPLSLRCLSSAMVTGLLVAALAPTPAVTQQVESARLEAAVAGLEWREVGPTIMGGRVSDLAVVESDPSTFYVGTATGGVWKTVNHGTTFEPIFDDQATASIGDVTVAPSNANVVWIGTGEPQNRQSSPWGNGVYRSTDAGRSWTHLGLESTHHIARIQVHPSDPDVAYVAAVGHLWGPNPERGVYRTTDGGESWDLVLFLDQHTGAIDLVMDPQDPLTLFAAMYQRQRTAWGFNGGGPGSGIYRTSDGGESWTELTDGLPEGDMGRIGLDLFRGDADLVFAIVEGDARRAGQGFGRGGGAGGDAKNGVYRSTDRGESWEQVSTTNNRPMYYSQIRVDPNDPERIYTGGSNLFKSLDGGRTFTPDAARGVHSDHHALWIDPADSDHLILGGDGGVSISWDRSESWRQLRNLPLAQFYEIGVDMRDPYHVCGGLQDNGSWCAPSDTWSNQGIRTRDWYNVGSGDGFFTVMHPSDPDVMFAESQGGNLTRVDLASMERTRMRPVARPREDGEDRSLRWNWDTPVALSTHDPNTFYIGSNVLFRSRDLGTSWDEISPDLTHAIDRTELEIMGVLGSAPMMSANDGQSSFGNLTAFSESPLDADVLFTGSDDGLVHVTRDGGDTWTDVTANVPGLPEQTYVTRLLASSHAAGTVYAAFDGHRSDDFDPYVYVSDDYGTRWRSIAGALPESSVNAIAQHSRNPDLLFVGNEVGIYVSIDGGSGWAPLSANLPTVPVDDIVIHPRENDLVIGTHGRGIWIMSDIGPLEHMTPSVLASATHLFPVRRATSFNLYTPQGWTPGIYEADNPPAGALIRYYVGADAEGNIVASGADDGGGPMANEPMAAHEGHTTVTILDGDGNTLRELEGTADLGVNEVIWDLRLAAPYETDGPPQGGGGFFGGGPRGPRVLPGTYTVRLEAGGESHESEVEVRLDPRVDISRADLLARQEALMSAYELAGPAYEAGQAIRRMTAQLNEVRTMVQERESAPADLREGVNDLLAELRALGEDINRVNGASRVSGAIESSTTLPTADNLWQLERAWSEAPDLIEKLNVLITDRMPAILGQVYQEGLLPEPGTPIPVPSRGGR